MKRSLLIHIYIAIFFFCLPSANDQVTQQQKTAATDSVRVSLLTCAAGGEIYSLFGPVSYTHLELAELIVCLAVSFLAEFYRTLDNGYLIFILDSRLVG